MHDMITTLLELAGLLLLVAALTVAGWRVAPDLGLAVGGLSMLGVSALVTWRHPAKPAVPSDEQGSVL